jgi:predicted transcriptional regulator
MSVTSVRIQEDLKQPLERLADKLQRSRNWLINEAVKEYISRQESESTKWKETLEAITSVKNGDVVDGEKVHTWMKSWGEESEQKPPVA